MGGLGEELGLDGSVQDRNVVACCIGRLVGRVVLCLALKVIFLHEAFLLRCVSSRVNLFPHLGHVSFLALPLDLFSSVL